MTISFFLVSLALSAPFPFIGANYNASNNNGTNPPNFPSPPLYDRIRGLLHSEVYGQHYLQRREVKEKDDHDEYSKPLKNPDNFPSPPFYGVVSKLTIDGSNDTSNETAVGTRRMFSEDYRHDNYEDPHDGPRNSARAFFEASNAAVISPWRIWTGNFPFDEEDITDEDVKPETPRRVRRFIPGIPNPFVGLQRLFEPGQDSWDPNIPYVIYSSPNTRPGFRPNGAVSSYTGVDRNAIRYSPSYAGNPQTTAYSPAYGGGPQSPYSPYSSPQLVTQPGVAKKKK